MPNPDSKCHALPLTDEALTASPGARSAAATEDPRASISTQKCVALSHHRVRDTETKIIREEPLEIQIHGRTLLVTMRTPGHDQDLAHGILLTERIIESAADVQALHHCSTAEPAAADGNLIKVALRPGREVDFEALQRNFVTNSSCGICGKTAIAKALATASPLADTTRFAASILASLPDLFLQQQILFAQTGGAHAAALFTASGDLLALREDVGRHNAVDKVLGWASRMAWLPLTGRLLMVSGRISFEIVQKALVARVPLVVGISAPTSLAVALAEQAGMTLVGFLRGHEMNVYGHAQRILDLHE